MRRRKSYAGLRTTRGQHGVPVVVDPILGDNGRRYNSVTTEQVEAMKRLIGHADVITPNLTEACLLADVPCEHADWQ